MQPFIMALLLVHKDAELLTAVPAQDEAQDGCVRVMARPDDDRGTAAALHRARHPIYVHAHEWLRSLVQRLPDCQEVKGTCSTFMKCWRDIS